MVDVVDEAGVHLEAVGPDSAGEAPGIAADCARVADAPDSVSITRRQQRHMAGIVGERIVVDSTVAPRSGSSDGGGGDALAKEPSRGGDGGGGGDVACGVGGDTHHNNHLGRHSRCLLRVSGRHSRSFGIPAAAS